MSSDPREKKSNLLKRFLKDRNVFIIDRNKTTRDGVIRCLDQLDVHPKQIHPMRSFEAAIELMQKLKPAAIFTDYDLEDQYGIELLGPFREVNPDPDQSLFVIITANTAQSAIAQAAEENVDTFVLKPFSSVQLEKRLIKVVLQKVQPDDYGRAIKTGKRFLAADKPNDAIQEFTTAVGLDSKPSLAYYYRGFSNTKIDTLSEAEGDYREGLNVNRLHYKCLVGLYDLLLLENKPEEAYDIVKRLARYFPANPKRLAGVLRLAIVTKNYHDVEHFYQTFANIEERNSDLVKYICAGLMVCGKYYLQHNHPGRAIDLFKKAAAASSNQPGIIKEIILYLLESRRIDEARKFLPRFGELGRETIDFQVAKFVLDFTTGIDPYEALSLGDKLVLAGQESFLIYDILSKSAARLGMEKQKNSYLAQIRTRWPENIDKVLLEISVIEEELRKKH